MKKRGLYRLKHYNFWDSEENIISFDFKKCPGCGMKMGVRMLYGEYSWLCESCPTCVIVKDTEFPQKGRTSTMKLKLKSGKNGK